VNRERASTSDAPLVLEQLESSVNGLTDEQVDVRLRKYGSNEIGRGEIRTVFGILLAQFKNPLIMLLIVASLVSAFVGEVSDAIIIISIILINSVLGFYQEYRSEKALEKLNKYLTFTAQVRRNGERRAVDTRVLVPGDIVLIETGDVVPADIRILEADDLSVEEAALTGESYPVTKISDSIIAEALPIQDMKNISFMGTYVKTGRGEGIVIATGQETYFGKTAQLLKQIRRESRFQKTMTSFGYTLIKVVLASVAALFAINLFLGKNVLDILLFSLALAIGMVPEALPIVITICLSSGALHLASKKVVVKRLVSVEDLGNVDVLCTDKTGTITENMITLEKYIDVNHIEDEKILLYASICNPVRSNDQIGNPIDTAIWRFSEKNLDVSSLSEYELLKEIPFNSNRKRNTVFVKKDDSILLITKGAPEILLDLSTYVLNEGQIVPLIDIEGVKRLYEEYGSRGYRVLAVAYREVEEKTGYSADDERELTFLGYIAFQDPLKETAREAFKLSREMNIEIKILTGDGPHVSKEIARQVGLEISDEEIVLGQEIDKLSDEELSTKLERIMIVSRATPEHKYRIVKALRSTGRVTACLGDGVNDAPALKEADVGIAVDQGTDITKDAADIVLLEKDLKVIVDGIREGRRTFSNIVKYVLYTISGNFGDLYTVGIASIVMPFLPLLPSQLILANFVTDTPVIAVSTDNVEKDELIRPRRWDINFVFKFSGILGVISAAFDALLIILMLNVFRVTDNALFRTALFLEIVLSEILVLFMIRSDKFFLRAEPPSKKLLVAALFGVSLTLAIIYTPLNVFFDFTVIPLETMLIVGLVTIGYVFVTEIVKLAYYNKLIKPLMIFLRGEYYYLLKTERDFIKKRQRFKI